MKPLTLLHGIGVAAALTAVSFPLRWLCLFLLPREVSGLAFWGALIGIYIAILLARAGRRPGRVVVGGGCGLLLALGASMLPVDQRVFLLGGTLLICVTRTMYFHPSLLGWAKDLAVSLFAFGLLGWTFEVAASISTGVWVFFLTHAAVALVGSGVECLKVEPRESDRFSEAKRAAEYALGQIVR